MTNEHYQQVSDVSTNSVFFATTQVRQSATDSLTFSTISVEDHLDQDSNYFSNL